MVQAEATKIDGVFIVLSFYYLKIQIEIYEQLKYRLEIINKHQE
jgi:hypothetical protein